MLRFRLPCWLVMSVQLTLAAVTIAAPAHAQGSAASGPSGRVTDSTGASLAGVTVAWPASLELRLETYNLTNTPAFRNPQNDLGAANFGQITRTRGGPFLVQLGAKLRFSVGWWGG